ncbi:hypothetical protein UPYG_G00346770 [Umbra pygmaea]|uniref:Melanin-concentrating hormone n=1 Tax=Umbra pygmaea TaxID=75934 RepID=A0ABD0W1U9_UMBPY
MFSLYTVIFIMVLFSELSTRSVILAVPTGMLDEDRTNPESLSSILGEDTMTNKALVALGTAENGLGSVGEEGNTKIFVLSDVGLKGHTRRGMNTAFFPSLPAIAGPARDHAPAEYSLKVERRESDLDMLRCMIGRVYRPCWQA